MVICEVKRFVWRSSLAHAHSLTPKRHEARIGVFSTAIPTSSFLNSKKHLDQPKAIDIHTAPVLDAEAALLGGEVL
jgi:hypothetical protein